MEKVTCARMKNLRNKRKNQTFSITSGLSTRWITHLELLLFSIYLWSLQFSFSFNSVFLVETLKPFFYWTKSLTPPFRKSLRSASFSLSKTKDYLLRSFLKIGQKTFIYTFVEDKTCHAGEYINFYDKSVTVISRKQRGVICCFLLKLHGVDVHPNQLLFYSSLSSLFFNKILNRIFHDCFSQ